MGCLLGGRAGRYVRSAGTCYEQLTTVYPDLEDVDLQQPTPPLDPINGTVVNGYFRKGTDSRDKRTSAWQRVLTTMLEGGPETADLLQEVIACDVMKRHAVDGARVSRQGEHGHWWRCLRILSMLS